MPGSPTTITLSVRHTGTPPKQGFLSQAHVNGEVVAPNQPVSPEVAQRLREFSATFNRSFERRPPATIATDALKGYGTELFNVWLGPAWDRIQPKLSVGGPRLLVIASEVPEVLNLPWEMLCLPSSGFLGYDSSFGIRRLPKADGLLGPAAGELPARPLRVLYMVCAPCDQVELDYEREEESLLQAIGQAGSDAVIDSGELGTFEELRDRIDRFRPHVVHLTGHGAVRDDGVFYFAFEDERGQTDPTHPAQEIRELFAGSGVQCAF